MHRKYPWMKLLMKSVGGGGILAYLIHLLLKTPLERAFEYAGVVFLLLAVVFFMTPSFTSKNKEQPLADTSYVFIFGFTGFFLLCLPLIL
ncbi:MAG: hypothetical protein GX046_10610 [Tissierellia bacterium]|nr:hypothetical protein [Tissierellia bacterium]